MVKKTEKQSANISYEEMRIAIPKINRRIKDLEEFNIESVTEQFSSEIKSLETKLEHLLSGIYSHDTIEYSQHEYSLTQLDCQSMNMMHKTPIHEVKSAIERNIKEALAILRTLAGQFEENLEDAGIIGSEKPLKAYEGLQLHQAIDKASSRLFKNGHYANAIEDGVKALNNIVRLHSGIEMDGIKLMEKVFSTKNPVLKINDLQDESDINEQKGFMQLFSGAVTGLRNPRAHKIIKDDPEMALEFIAFISLLAKFVDKSEKV
jgi:uncharacterized protein (TIGR02391 family)